MPSMPHALPDVSGLTKPDIDLAYLNDALATLLSIPSPTGYTETISRWVVEELTRLGLKTSLTRRGAIRAWFPSQGNGDHPQTGQAKRAIVSHIDTLGAMVMQLKNNGRLSVQPIGTWSSRFAEGARVTIFTDRGHQRGTIMPLKSSGHAYNEEVDTQPVNWDQVEIRIDDFSRNEEELFNAGFRVGDFVAIDPFPEFRDNGYIVSRHLDDKAGVACVLTAIKALIDGDLPMQVPCEFLFTISEEVGSGAAAVLHEDVMEMVAVDNGVNAPNQNTAEYDVTVAMMDSTGPFDYHLTRWLLHLARNHEIRHARDVFRYYRSDAGSAVDAGNDTRTALVCFGVDGSHGYERTHIDSLKCVTELLILYAQSQPAVPRDVSATGDLTGFPAPHTAQPPTLERHAPDQVNTHHASNPPNQQGR